ncbi:MAG TPA: response regulator [Bacillota bacterium]|nr:response regulator [Bacillota bacterium]
MSGAGTVELAKNVFWVGGNEQNGGLHCNPYLIVDGEEAVLIDPGSVLDFEYVYANVCSIVPLERIKYIILHHQDPDFCSSVPLFEQKGACAKIVTHWRTETLVKYYGIKSDYYIVNEHGFRLVLKSGRVLGFIQTPYLHFPGAITTYDYSSKILFSSDLFGAFSYEWNLYANDDYIEKMKTFHEHYMPSNDIIRPVMEKFLTLDIAMIAPQHGSVIRNNIEEHIKALRDLECGTLLAPVKKDMVRAGGYRFICTTVLKRYASVFNRQEVLEAVEGLDIILDQDNLEISDYNYRGSELWNLLFEQILARKGVKWLLVIEPLVQTLSGEYDVRMPRIFETTLVIAQEEAASLNTENMMLRETNRRLNDSIREAQERLLKCPVTGLYNYDFFQAYLSREIDAILDQQSQQNPALIIISADNMSKIKFRYGDAEVDEALRNIVYEMNSVQEPNSFLFRLQGASFACYLPHTGREQALALAEKIRNSIGTSETFIEKITVSVGVICLEEIRDSNLSFGEPAELFYNTANMRVKLAKDMGMNIVCSYSAVEHYQEELGKILIVDTDAVNVDVLRTVLENLKYRVLHAEDGEQALKLCEGENISLIISEVMLPKMDGFLVRERLLANSNTKRTPFILVSHLKNEDSVQRASGLTIDHYLKKPYMLSELLGVIRNNFKGEAYK